VGALPAAGSDLAPPVRTLELELSGVIDAIDDRHPVDGRYGWAVALVRLHRAPLGSIVMALPEGGIPGEAVRSLAEARLADEIAAHLAGDDLATEADRGAGREIPLDPACLRSTARFLVAAPPLSVVVASRDRPEQVVACVSALLAMDYPDLEIIVVDNAPSTDATARLIADRFSGRPEVRYVREDRPGTSRARNRGLRTATAGFVAFTDDDVLVDPGWAAALIRPMVEDERVGCVTGLVVAAELETSAQLWFEEYGGFAKGYRQVVHELAASEVEYPATRQVVHELAASELESPLFPYAAGALGTGASMAFRTQVLRSIGGFDPALGGGTPSRGGEDLAAYVEVLLAGWRLVYEPAAIGRHFHRRTYEDLRRVMLGYGSGLSAYLTRTAIRDPRRIPGIARRALYGTRFLLDPRSPKNARKQPGYPAELTRLELQGILCGPFWYARGVLAARRAGRSRFALPIRKSGPRDERE
jgi:GT2 family glycosyltransferase